MDNHVIQSSATCGASDSPIRCNEGAQDPHILWSPLPELPERIRDKRARYGAYRDRALRDLERIEALTPNALVA